MSARTIAALTLLALAACATVQGEPAYTPATYAERQAQCANAGDGREAWVAPAPPVRIFGNTYDVGTCGITALLVTSPEGHVLLDTGMPEVAEQIVANIRALGADPADVAWLLSSHEHLDHVGATAEVKRLTGARAAALVKAQQPLETGEPWPEDPQLTIIPRFEGFAIDRVMQDGDTLEVGGMTFTIHATPAHTPGSTSWTWESCEDGNCWTMTYADSLSTPAADSYRFSDHEDYATGARKGFAAAAALPCGILLTPHPSASGMDERLASGTPANPSACRAYASQAEANFDRRLAGEVSE